MRTNQLTAKSNNYYLILIGVLSIAVPVLVAVLFYMPRTGKLIDLDVYFLPKLNAVLNSATAIALISGYYFIKSGKQRYHITAMITAFGLSTIFLLSYVTYHMAQGHVKYGDIDGDGLLSAAELAEVGIMRIIYLVVTLSHIVLAAIIVPFVLLSVYFGWTKQYNKHRKLSKWTFPMWLYVAVTGVIVFLMISPYYPA